MLNYWSGHKGSGWALLEYYLSTNDFCHIKAARTRSPNNN